MSLANALINTASTKDHQLNRNAMRLLKIIVGVIALTASVYFGLPVFFRFYHPLPILAAGISSHSVSDAEAKSELTRRLSQKFPIGSAEAILKTELDREGWGPVYTDNINRSQYPWRYVRFKRSISVMFVEVATVGWKSDEEGNLTEIRGGYFRDVFFKQGGW
jgi:hypothetical protein